MAASSSRPVEIPSLELLLRAWEDRWFACSLADRARLAEGQFRRFVNHRAIVNWTRFRQFLLKVHQRASSDPEGLVEAFDFNEPDTEESPTLIGDMAAVFLNWTLCSRRIYRLSPEVAAILSQISLGDITWRDLDAPFPAFTIELPSPWQDPDAPANRPLKMDLLSVSRFVLARGENPPFSWDLRFFDSSRKDYTPTNRIQRERLQTLANRNRWGGVRTGTDEILTQLSRIRGARFSVDGQDLDERVMDTADRIWGLRAASGRTELYPGSRACLEKMIRIFVGLTLYMRTLPSGSPHIARLPPLPHLSTPDRKVITDRAEVFSVLSRWTLTRDERVMLGLEGTAEERRMMEMSWHFRQLHWRRRPGQGQNPLALREVFVDWTLVRRDRMPTELGLPGGGDATV